MIRLKNVVKQYRAGVVAVDRLCLNIEKGERFAFLGPNGAGKTTTVRMLTTLLTPTSGTVELNGIDCVNDRLEARKHFGVVFQDPSLDLDLTALENMTLHAVLYRIPKQVRLERIKELLNLFQLWERRDAFVRHFSGGMRRRLEIARGLLHSPQVLFLDEPTAGLDPQSRNQLWAQLVRMNNEEGVTVFLTTHNMEEAEQFARTIAVFDRGKIVAMGSSEDLKTQTGAESLEDAFLNLTGHSIDAAAADPAVEIRGMARIWGK
jgi:ABC-2 type transport system ATP-binding protein